MTPEPPVTPTEQCVVDMVEDDGERARAECRVCCWATSGASHSVYDKADAHETESGR